MDGIGQITTQEDVAVGIAALFPLVRSPRVDQVMPALARVQGALHNPRPNATGVITEGRDRRTYRYVTLDGIIDHARDVLAGNGILVTHHQVTEERAPKLFTMLTHAESGQYVGVTFPLPGNVSPMNLKAACTLGRRTNLECLLNISTETDRDAGEGVPDSEAPRNEKRPSTEALDWLLFLGWRNEKPTPQLALTVIKAWIDNPTLSEMRYERARREEWQELVQATYQLFQTVYSVAFATAWCNVFDCQTVDDFDLFRARYDSALKADIEALRGDHKLAVAYLTTHLIAQIKAIEKHIRERTELDAEVGAIEAQATAPAHHLYDAAGEVASDAFTDPHAYADAFEVLFLATDITERRAICETNEHGLDWLEDFPREAQAISDLLGDADNFPPKESTKLSEDEARADDAPAMTPAMVEANRMHADMLAEQRRAPAASVPTLDELVASGVVTLGVQEASSDDEEIARTDPLDEFEPPGADERAAPAEAAQAWDSADLRVRKAVEVPIGRSGAPNLGKYLEALESDLASVNDVPSMQAWLAANEPVYRAENFSLGTRVRAIKMAAKRCRLLGMRPTEEE